MNIVFRSNTKANNRAYFTSYHIILDVKSDNPDEAIIDVSESTALTALTSLDETVVDDFVQKYIDYADVDCEFINGDPGMLYSFVALVDINKSQLNKLLLEIS